MSDVSTRVQFAHGLEGSPQGTKARLLAGSFDARTPAMEPSDFQACVALHARTAADFRPHVLVGSSFGGAVALALLQRGDWRGPTLLLAPAWRSLGLAAELPEAVPVRIVHGRRDTLVPPADSRTLAAAGDPAHVRLLEVDDDHPLRETAAHHLLDWVRELAREAR